MTKRWRVDVWFHWREEARMTSTEVDARSAGAAVMRVFNRNRGAVLVSRSYRIEVGEIIPAGPYKTETGPAEGGES